MEKQVGAPEKSQYENVSFTLQDMVAKSTLTANVNQDCFVTTTDKVQLTLLEYEKTKNIASNWYSYLGMFISFLIPALTAEFKDIWFIDAASLRAAFWLASIGSLFLTVIAIIKRIKKREEFKLDYWLKKIKNGSTTEQ